MDGKSVIILSRPFSLFNIELFCIIIAPFWNTNTKWINKKHYKFVSMSSVKFYQQKLIKIMFIVTYDQLLAVHPFNTQ